MGYGMPSSQIKPPTSSTFDSSVGGAEDCIFQRFSSSDGGTAHCHAGKTHDRGKQEDVRPWVGSNHHPFG